MTPPGAKTLVQRTLIRLAGALMRVFSACRLHYVPDRYEVVSTRVPLDRWPEEAGLRIVWLSDFHFGPLNHPKDYEPIIHKANELAPDLIALGGDLAGGDERYWQEVPGLIGQLRAPLGVYAILGNHDYYYLHPHRLRADLEAQGVRVLVNEHVVLTVGGEMFCLGGVDDLWEGSPDIDQTFAGAPKEAPRILLAHNPDWVSRLGGQRVELVLSGHTHGGQICLPSRALFTSTRLGHARGLMHLSQTCLYVSRGLGAQNLPWRINCPSEVSLIQVMKAPDTRPIAGPTRKIESHAPPGFPAEGYCLPEE